MDMVTKVIDFSRNAHTRMRRNPARAHELISVPCTYVRVRVRVYVYVYLAELYHIAMASAIASILNAEQSPLTLARVLFKGANRGTFERENSDCRQVGSLGYLESLFLPFSVANLRSSVA